MTAIETIGLEYIYADGTPALSGVNFEARVGEKVAVLGRMAVEKPHYFIILMA